MAKYVIHPKTKAAVLAAGGTLTKGFRYPHIDEDDFYSIDSYLDAVKDAKPRTVWFVSGGIFDDMNSRKFHKWVKSLS